jgi:F0F1-type ATP synthase membrane subunit b/b'
MTSIQRTGIAVLLALLAIFGIYKYGYNSGWGDRDAEMQAEIAKKNEESREKEQEMAKAVADKETELRKANDVVSQKQTDLNRLIAAGRVRLPTASCVQAAPSAPVAVGNSNQAPSQPDRAPEPDTGPSESERQTLQLIAQIAAEGDRAINQLNACIDAYDNMRNIINAQR